MNLASPNISRSLGWITFRKASLFWWLWQKLHSLPPSSPTPFSLERKTTRPAFGNMLAKILPQNPPKSSGGILFDTGRTEIMTTFWDEEKWSRLKASGRSRSVNSFSLAFFCLNFRLQHQKIFIRDHFIMQHLFRKISVMKKIEKKSHNKSFSCTVKKESMTAKKRWKKIAHRS